MNLETARKIADKCITPSTARMSPDERHEGVMQMIEDLAILASRDGCVAAAWALEVIESMADYRIEDMLSVNILQDRMNDLEDVRNLLRALQAEMVRNKHVG